MFKKNVLLVVAALTPLLFIVAQNQHIYLIPQIIASIIFVTIFCIIFLEVCSLVNLFKFRNTAIENNTPIKRQVVLNTLTIPLILLTFLILLFGILLITGNLVPAKYPFSIVCFYALILFTFGLLYSAVNARIFGIMLYSFIFISLVHLSLSILRDSFELSDISSTPTTIEKVQFTTRPNIYLFLLESFHSRDVLKKVYDIDTLQFSNKLVAEGYSLYDPVYANYYATLFSTASLFRMDHSFYAEDRGKIDINIKTSKLISGGPGNNALDILKINGYSVAYIHSINGIYRYKNSKIDYTNLNFPFGGLFKPIYDIEALMIQLIRPMFRLNNNFREWVRTVFIQQPRVANLKSSSLEKTSDARLHELMTHIIKSSKTSQPVFRFIYWIGAAHTDSRIGSISDQKIKLEYAASWKLEYRDIVQKAEVEILDVVQNIEKYDPGALVILIGDHGAWLKGRMIEDKNKNSTSLDELKAYAAEFGFSLADLTKDVSSVFLAIKWPKGVNVPVGQPVSHVNLFRLIFSALSNDETFMLDAVPNTSYFLVPGLKPRVYNTVREGVVLDDWQLFEKSTKTQN